MSSRFTDNNEANIQSSTEVHIRENKKGPKHQPSQAVEEYNKFFKAAMKMSGINVKDYNRAKLNHEISINSVRASHSTKKLAREAPRDDTHKSLKKMKARNSKDNLQSRDDLKSSQKSLKIKSAKILKKEDLINKHLEITVPKQSLDEPKVLTNQDEQSPLYSGYATRSPGEPLNEKFLSATKSRESTVKSELFEMTGKLEIMENHQPHHQSNKQSQASSVMSFSSSASNTTPQQTSGPRVKNNQDSSMDLDR